MCNLTVTIRKETMELNATIFWYDTLNVEILSCVTTITVTKLHPFLPSEHIGC